MFSLIYREEEARHDRKKKVNTDRFREKGDDDTKNSTFNAEQRKVRFLGRRLTPNEKTCNAFRLNRSKEISKEGA